MDRPVAIRVSVSSFILVLFLVSGWMVSRGQAGTTELVAHFLALIIGFWVPAQALIPPNKIRSKWKLLVPYMLGATLVWDVFSSMGNGGRPFFSEWYIVYLSGPLLFLGLLFLHAVIGRAVLNRLNKKAKAEEGVAD